MYTATSLLRSKCFVYRDYRKVINVFAASEIGKYRKCKICYNSQKIFHLGPALVESLCAVQQIWQRANASFTLFSIFLTIAAPTHSRVRHTPTALFSDSFETCCSTIMRGFPIWPALRSTSVGWGAESPNQPKFTIKEDAFEDFGASAHCNLPWALITILSEHVLLGLEHRRFLEKLSAIW